MRPEYTLTSRAWIIAALIALASPVSLGAYNPDNKVERVARRHDRKLERELDRRTDSGPWFLERSDALALTVDALGRDYRVVKVSENGVETDWRYDMDSGTDKEGEWFEQRRMRLLVDVTGEAELRITPVVVAEKRRFTAGQPEPQWERDFRVGMDERDAVQVELHRRAHNLEAERLQMLQVRVNADQLLQYIEPVVPEGFELHQAARPIELFADTRVEEENEKKGLWATWERQAVIQIQVMGRQSPHIMTVTTSERERFSNQGGSGEWQDVALVDPRPAEEVLRGLIRTSSALVILPPAANPMPDARDLALTAPTPVPRLRTRAELETVALDKDREAANSTATGWFRIQVLSAQVNPVRGDGHPWDGENAETEGDDGAYLAPDVGGRITMAGTTWSLPVQQDTLAPNWTWSVTSAFEEGLPLIELTLFDEDFDVPDTIGSCKLELRRALRAGGTLVGDCEMAQVTLRVDFASPL